MRDCQLQLSISSDHCYRAMLRRRRGTLFLEKSPSYDPTRYQVVSLTDSNYIQPAKISQKTHKGRKTEWMCGVTEIDDRLNRQLKGPSAKSN